MAVMAVWNNHFLPLMIVGRSDLHPLTVGVGPWAQRVQGGGSTHLVPLVVIGGLVTIISMVALFLLVQRYRRGGLLLGSIAN